MSSNLLAPLKLYEVTYGVVQRMTDLCLPNSSLSHSITIHVNVMRI